MSDKWAGLIKILEELREEGHETLQVGNLLDYLKADQEEEGKRGEVQRFYERLKCDINLEEYRQKVNIRIEMLRSVLTLGHNALRATFLLNGTASISLLAFLGNIWSKSPGSTSGEVLATPLLFFSTGAFSSVAATCLTWCSQDRYFKATKEEKNSCPWGDAFKILAISAGIISLVAFLWGIIEAIQAFKPIS